MTDIDDLPDQRGFAQIPRWLQQSTDVTAHAKLVYLALSSRADRTGSSWPSHETLATEASCSIASVKRALAELRELGVVTWSGRAKQGRGQTSNVYRIAVSVPVDNSSEPVAQGELPGGPVAQGDLGGSSHRATNETQMNEEELKSSGLTTEPAGSPVENDDDLDSSWTTFPKPSNVARLHPRAIDRAALAASVGFYFLESKISDEQLHMIALAILGKATSHVTDPTAYVIAAIRNDTAVWQRFAFDLAAGGSLAVLR